MNERRYRQVHLDFHTSADCEGVGADFDPEVFAQTVRMGRVNSMTVFAKCHHGALSTSQRRCSELTAATRSVVSCCSQC